MDSEGPAQPFETPLNMSDYVNFDLEVDTSNSTMESNPGTSVDMCVDDSSVTFDDATETDLAGMFQSPDGSNALRFGLDAVETASAESGETDAAFCDSITLSPTSEGSDLTDTFQTKAETNAMPDDLTMFEPMAFASPAALATPRSPSRWVPVSSQLQQHLNAVYASQLNQLAADPNPPPVLYLPAAGSCVSPMPSTWSMPSDDLPRTDFTQTPQLNTEPLSVDPSLLMQEKGAVSRPLSSSSGTYQPVLPATDIYVSNVEDPILAPIKKRTLGTDESGSGPATKRCKTAKALTIAVNNIYSNDEDHAGMTRAQNPRHNPLPNAAKNEHSIDESDHKAEDNPSDEFDESDSSGLSSTPASPFVASSPVTKDTSVPLSGDPAPKKGPNWRYEQAKEIRLRNQRRKEWNRRHTDSGSAKGEASNRKMQKLLEEIEDTMEFAEARGYEVGESVGGDGVLRRSARKGARKNYAGQE